MKEKASVWNVLFTQTKPERTFLTLKMKKANKSLNGSGQGSGWKSTKRALLKTEILSAEYIRNTANYLFSNKLIFTIEDSKLTRVDGSMRIFYDLKHSKQKDEIISPNIVLLTSRDKVQGVINSIVLGYLRPKNEELYDVPVWQVILHSGNELFFNAYTGEYVNLSH